MGKLMAAIHCLSTLLFASQLQSEMEVRVGEKGRMEVEVDGGICLADFGLTLAGPRWEFGYDLTEQARRGEMVEGKGEEVVLFRVGKGEEECGWAKIEVKADGREVKWGCEVHLEKDIATEVLRLDGHLPGEISAGQGGWFALHRDRMSSGFFPARLGPDLYWDTGFQWFGWLLKEGRGIQFRPDWRGITAFGLQDGRRWGRDYFQVCWNMGEGLLKRGSQFYCSITIQPLSFEEVEENARRFGESLLALEAEGEGQREKAAFRLKLTNLLPRARQVCWEWQITDEIYRPLRQFRKPLSLRPMETLVREVEVGAAERGEYRLLCRAVDEMDGASQELLKAFRFDVSSGPRMRVCLNGEWEFMPVLKGEMTYPPQGEWRKRSVPSSFSSEEIHHHGCWYRRSFEVPKFMAGKRIKLHFMAVNLAAKVYVNGHEAGEKFGGYLPFEVDITDLVKAGERNELCVAVRAWTAACLKPGEVRPLRPYENPGWSYLPPRSIVAPVGGRVFLCGIWQDVFLLAYPEVHVEDVFVITLVRGKRIKLQISLHNEGGSARQLELRNEVHGREGRSKRLPPKGVALGPGERKEVEVWSAWENPTLWGLNSPYLYLLETSLREEGREIDRNFTRFGFREVWTEGKQIVLNGVPLTLFADSCWDYDSFAAAAEHILRRKRAGIRSMRIHTQPFQPHILDAADELGMLIVDESAVYCWHHVYAIEDERFWQNYARHLRELALRDRNHPSLFMYSLENEIMHCGGKRKEWEERLARLADEVQEVDPTRLITYEADLDPGGKADVLGLHYAREYWFGDLVYPEGCYWLDGEIQGSGDLGRWKWKREKPLYLGEFDGGFFLWYPQFQAFWVGDEAYVGAGPRTVTEGSWRARMEGLAHEIAAYRYSGVAGLNAWIGLEGHEKLGKAGIYSPLFLWVREHPGHFYEGETVRRTVHVHNDLLEPATLKLAWETVLRGQKIGGGELPSLFLKPAEMKAVRVEFKIPPVKEKSPFLFRLYLDQQGKTACSREQRLVAFPRLGKPQIPAPVGLLDQVGETARVFRQVGVPFLPLNDLSLLPPQLKVLVLGRNSWTEASSQQALRLAKWVEGGGRLICLEQERYPEGWPGEGVVLERNLLCSMAFPSASEHPVLKGVSADDLRFWRPDGLVATRTLRKPSRGNFRTIIQAGGNTRDYTSALNGLSWAPLLEVVQGRGSYLLCQLELVKKFPVEPVAGRLLVNLLEYAAAAPPERFVRVALLTESNSPLDQELKRVGLEAEALAGRLAEADLAGYGLILIEGTEIEEEVKGHEGKLRKFVEKGGKVWIHDLKPEQIEGVGRLVGVNLRLRPLSPQSVWKAADDPLTSGLSNHELYWRDPPIWDQFTPFHSIAEYVVEIPGPSPLEVKALTEPGALVKIPVGRGFFLLDQLLWSREKRHGDLRRRLASILLTNLGAQLRPVFGYPVRASRFKRVEGSEELVKVEEEEVTMGTNGRVEAPIFLPVSGRYEIVLVGRGTPGKGEYPRLVVALDGQMVGEIEVDSEEFDEKSLLAEMPEGSHILSVALVNDYYDPTTGEDRNVWFQSVTLVPVGR